ncbi:hypothetical protein BJX68DRAFT_227564 [Aspergillus pseudodeflectus]|uniref:Tetratricopeptide repeat protein n=1 Tax=Aspergillus pseudodeflectus TaxID=176178 RepID=A0ABR4L3H6_9EURO
MHRGALRLHSNRDAGLWSVSRANLGKVLYRQGRYDEAVDMFQQALASAGEAATEQSPFVEMVSDRLEAALRDQKKMRKKNGMCEWLQWVATGSLMGRVWVQNRSRQIESVFSKDGQTGEVSSAFPATCPAISVNLR